MNNGTMKPVNWHMMERHVHGEETSSMTLVPTTMQIVGSEVNPEGEVSLMVLSFDMKSNNCKKTQFLVIHHMNSCFAYFTWKHLRVRTYPLYSLTCASVKLV